MLEPEEQTVAVEMQLPDLEISSGNHDLSTVKIFSGRANPKLAGEIANYLGVELSTAVIKNFKDGEVYVQIQESIRGHDVYVVQPTCNPVNESLMELLVLKHQQNSRNTKLY